MHAPQPSVAEHQAVATLAVHHNDTRGSSVSSQRQQALPVERLFQEPQSVPSPPQYGLQTPRQALPPPIPNFPNAATASNGHHHRIRERHASWFWSDNFWKPDGQATRPLQASTQPPFAPTMDGETLLRAIQGLNHPAADAIRTALLPYINKCLAEEMPWVQLAYIYKTILKKANDRLKESANTSSERRLHSGIDAGNSMRPRPPMAPLGNGNVRSTNTTGELPNSASDGFNTNSLNSGGPSSNALLLSSPDSTTSMNHNTLSPLAPESRAFAASPLPSPAATKSKTPTSTPQQTLVFKPYLPSLTPQPSEKSDCPICMDQLTKGQHVVHPSCHASHLFHVRCLRAWMMQSPEEIPSCPQCRQTLKKIFRGAYDETTDGLIRDKRDVISYEYRYEEAYLEIDKDGRRFCYSPTYTFRRGDFIRQLNADDDVAMRGRIHLRYLPPGETPHSLSQSRQVIRSTDGATPDSSPSGLTSQTAAFDSWREPAGQSSPGSEDRMAEEDGDGEDFAEYEDDEYEGLELMELMVRTEKRWVEDWIKSPFAGGWMRRL